MNILLSFRRISSNTTAIVANDDFFIMPTSRYDQPSSQFIPRIIGACKRRLREDFNERGDPFLDIIGAFDAGSLS